MGGGDPIRVICGPTAAGKSAIALALAERYPVTIISADSRQVYRGFDIGTAKPSAAERRTVPHLGIDIASPAERYSAGRWADAASGWIDDVESHGRIPLVVGGTGLYLRALFDEFFEQPAMDSARRARLEAEIDRWPTETLRAWCAVLDPERATLGRTQLLRAIETALLTGERISTMYRARRRLPRRAARYLLVDPGPPLREWIAGRAARMLDGGWIEEVRGLLSSVPDDAPAWNAAGYDAVRRLVRGETQREDAERTIVERTRQYAKRQRTWFRHQLPAGSVTAVVPGDPDVMRRVEAWWNRTVQ